MKVCELIVLLQQQDPSAEVIIEDAHMAAFLSSDDGNESSDHYHRVTGIELAYGCDWEIDMNFDLSVTAKPSIGPIGDHRLVRILGSSSDPIDPTSQRRFLGPGMSFQTITAE